jgi:hypothetical protein
MAVFYLLKSKFFLVVNIGFWVLLFGIFGYFYPEKNVLLGTSLIGCYFTVRAAGLIFSGFPN